MKKLDFNRNWTMQKDGSSQVKAVNLPHDAMLLEPRHRNAPTAGASAFFEGGRYIYKKIFDAPADWKSQRLILECEGVYQNAEVILNGAKLNEWHYGYTQFFTNLTGHIRFGEANELVVIADNSETPNSRWYSGSGIYRPVWLYVGPQNAISPEGLKITVLDDKNVSVDVELLSETEGTELRIELLDGETVIASSQEMHAKFTVQDARLWSAERPELYRCRVSVLKDEHCVDCAEENFGFRSISWGGSGLKINGKETLLRGACIHHDNGILGAACFADAEERRVRILKEAGFNAIRSAHNPISKAMLNACDRLGMYVMDESFDMWYIPKNPFDYSRYFEACWKKDLTAMVEKDRSHPSVILYSIGNEISDLGQEKGQELCRQMAETVRSLDGSRPVTLGINLMLAGLVSMGTGLYGTGKKEEKDSGAGTLALDNMPTSSFFNVLMNLAGSLNERLMSIPPADKISDKVGGMLDLPGYNYAAPRYRKEIRRHPKRAIVGSETLPKTLYRNWQLVKELPQLVGDFMWTGWDYLGEVGIGIIRYTDRKTKKDVSPGLAVIGGCGVIDICGHPRAEVGWNKIIWGLQSEPTIGVEPLTHAKHFRSTSAWRDTNAVTSWSWAGCEGQKTDVVVYADAAAVELFVNDRFYGRKKVKQDKVKFPDVTYEPGCIRAVSFDAAGIRIGASELHTAEGKTRLQVMPDKTRLRANGQDLCFVEISLTGEGGTVKASADQELTVTVDGVGTLQAFGSADPYLEDDFFSKTHRSYYGRALAVVRAGVEKGQIIIKISGQTLETQSIVIDVEEEK